MFVPPGVYAPQGDTALLLRALLHEEVRAGARTLDLCTGTGILAIAAACGGATATAVDVSGSAVAAARLNARRHACSVRLIRGDLERPVAGEQFDLVTVNPPYVPSPSPRLPAHGPARAWDAGPTGRFLLDRICRLVPSLLAPGGVLLVVQSSLAGVDLSLEELRRAGLRARVVGSRTQRFGPVMAARTGWFEHAGLAGRRERSEELFVIRAEHTQADTTRRDPGHRLAKPANGPARSSDREECAT
ncbi:HemK2/MTQ2 family protein methyltransferase [Streptomyces sp. NPDC005573]|uniref:HemK2/MTQ2 family protein methyltransferase n=1 Tax=Streptomyces sp. NPDC005573 TaxID=3156890 RepID=UPI0033B676F2